jgi:hypothetical protein
MNKEEIKIFQDRQNAREFMTAPQPHKKVPKGILDPEVKAR